MDINSTLGALEKTIFDFSGDNPEIITLVTIVGAVISFLSFLGAGGARINQSRNSKNLERIVKDQPENLKKILFEGREKRPVVLEELNDTDTLTLGLEELKAASEYAYKTVRNNRIMTIALIVGVIAATSTLATTAWQTSGLREAVSVHDSRVEFIVQRVFFGTNREIEGATNVGPFFGYNSSKKLLTGVADVTIPNSEDVRRIGEIPLPKSFTVWKITLWQQAEDPKRHFSVQNVEILEKDEFASLASEAANGASKYPKTAFVFIHGYNTPFRSAVFRSAQIAWDMRFDGPAFLYSWPAIGNSLDYGTDIASARSAAPFLDEFLELVAGLEGVDQVHLIAHSMGSEALAEVLTRNGLSFARNDETKIDQLILAAPDLDAERFLQITDHFDNASEDITLYASSKDKALLVAQSLVRTNKPRLGFVQPDGPIVHPSIFSIDVSVASTEIFGINHNTYVKDRTLIDDIGRLLKFGVQPPDDRMPSLNAHDTPNGVYWRIRE